jgi:putative hemolysin
MLLAALLLLYLALLGLLAVISAAETAIHSARDLEQQLLAAGEGSVARRLREITVNPFAQLQRTLLVSAALNLSLAALGLWLVTGPLRALGWQPWLSGVLLFGITLVLGDLLPKFLASRSPSAVLLGSLRLLRPLRFVLDPATSVADRAADLLLARFVPQNVKTRLPVTREEFETLVEMREEQGFLDASESAMIHEVLDIEELTVRDCMIPRVDLQLVCADDPEPRVTSVLDRAAGRFVIVYGETPDSVAGTLDVTAWRLAGRPAWRTLMRTPVFVPETMPILDALKEHLHAGDVPLIIVDEYGGLEGLVTRREIADWLLYDTAPWLGEASEIRDLGRGRYLVDGGTRLDHLREELDLPIEDEGGLDTLGGLVFNQLGHVPKPGERLRLAGCEIKVRRVVRARIQELELRIEEERPQDSSS